MKRSSGILLPVFSLPSPYGIGTLGAAAREWIDFLAAAGQTWWQILPVGPTSYGDSPYQSPSAFAGNPYFIDLDELVSEGLLTQNEADSCDCCSADPDRVDYERLYRNRLPLLAKAAQRGLARQEAEVAAFYEEQKDWLADYALFMAVKKHFGGQAWQEWADEGIRLRRPEALRHYEDLLSEEIRIQVYIQYLFFRQWNALRAYASQKGVGILGDLPLYVAMDSADVWAAPEYFQLDEKNVPIALAGVPPDSFNADGQFWGNPLYNYDRMARDGYAWWIRRIGGAARLYDAIRIDHFRGIESYWSVPYGEETAANGAWIKGPGMDLISVLKKAYPDLFFIAEDLGYPTPEVQKLLADSGFPGMHVLQFSFDSDDEGSTLPHRWTTNSICYSGTHDNHTLRGWLHEAKPKDVETALAYIDLDSEDERKYVHRMLCVAMASVCDLCIAQMQDWLALPGDARINAPGTTSGNWRWRMTEGPAPGLAEEICKMTQRYERMND